MITNDESTVRGTYRLSYYEMNKEKIKAYQKIQKECPKCGEFVPKYIFKRHTRTKKCREYVSFSIRKTDFVFP